MIGLGKWQAEINNIIFKGSAVFTIADNNGEYKISLELPGEDLGISDIAINNIQEDGDTLTGEKLIFFLAISLVKFHLHSQMMFVMVS